MIGCCHEFLKGSSHLDSWCSPKDSIYVTSFPVLFFEIALQVQIISKEYLIALLLAEAAIALSGGCVVYVMSRSLWLICVSCVLIFGSSLYLYCL